MFKGDQEIKPDGRIQIKIKIPDNMKDREGLEIVHIMDDGTVINMNAEIKGDYIEFVTDNLVQYAIVANDNCLFGICKAFGQYDPEKGICYDWIYITIAIILIIAITGLVVYKKKKKQ